MLLNTVSSGKRRLKKIEWSGYPVLYGLREEIGGKANKEWNWKWRDRFMSLMSLMWSFTTTKQWAPGSAKIWKSGSCQNLSQRMVNFELCPHEQHGRSQ